MKDIFYLAAMVTTIVWLCLQPTVDRWMGNSYMGMSEEQKSEGF